MTTLYQNAKICTPDGFEVRDFAVSDGLVAAVDSADQTVDLAEKIVAPGYVDVHIHGAFGVDCIDADGAVATMAKGLPRHGVTGFFPTLLTAPLPQMRTAFAQAADLMRRPAGGAKVMGVHSEGPFFTAAKAGAQPRESLLLPSVDALTEIIQDDPTAMAKLSLAAELPGGTAVIEFCRQNNIVASLGHTEATYEQAVALFAAGVSCVTHLYNAMSPLHHRSPGPIAAALLSQNVVVELIADGIHIHPAMLQLAVGLAGARCVLVSDAMMGAGLPEGEYMLGPNQVFVRDGAARLADGVLAGSVLTLDVAVRNMAAWGVPLHQAISMAAIRPRVLHDLPTQTLTPGQPADFVVLDSAANVVQTVVDGRVVYAQGQS